MEPTKLRFNEAALSAIQAGRDPDHPLPPRGSKAYYRDSVEEGLRVEVHPTGRIRFFTRRRARRGQQPRPYSPGYWPEISVTQARRWLQNLKADLNRSHAAQVAPGAQLTLREGWQLYLEQHLQRRGARRWKDDEGAFKKWLGGLANVPMGEIDRADVIALHEAVKDQVAARGHRHVGKYSGNRTANKAKTLVFRIYSYCAKRGVHYGPNPAAGIEPFQERVRERFIRDDEMQPWLEAALRPACRPDMRALALVILFTGLRLENALALHSGWFVTWKGIRAIRVPEEAFKTGRAVTIPLVTQAQTVIRQRQLETGGPWLFPSPRAAGGHLVDPRKAWEDAFGHLELAHFNRHDLRRTLDTWMEVVGAPDSVRARMLGQVVGGVRRHYSHADLATTRDWAQRAVDRMLEVAGVQLWHPWQTGGR